VCISSQTSASGSISLQTLLYICCYVEFVVSIGFFGCFFFVSFFTFFGQMASNHYYLPQQPVLPAERHHSLLCSRIFADGDGGLWVFDAASSEPLLHPSTCTTTPDPHTPPQTTPHPPPRPLSTHPTDQRQDGQPTVPQSNWDASCRTCSNAALNSTPHCDGPFVSVIQCLDGRFFRYVVRYVSDLYSPRFF